VEQRDRTATLALLGAAIAAWAVVAGIVTTRDPVADPGAGILGAVAIGAAAGLTAAPLLWLAGFARNGRIAYRNDWIRAARRGGWVALLVALFVGLRLQGALELPIALFVVVMVLLGESTLSSGPRRHR
jgi:hypothetical protein